MNPTIYAPLRAERFALRRARTPVVRTGMGPSRVSAVDGPALVAGVAGGLGADVRPGDVVVASEVRGPDRTVACPSAPILAGALRRLGLTVHVGPIVSEPRLVTGARRRVLAESGALAVDMESAFIAPPDGQPFAVVRTISDTDQAPLLRPGTAVRGIRALKNLARAVPALDAWADAIGPRELTLASPRSFCAGVERAIDTVAAALDRFGAPVYVRRQIVHNAHVVSDLERRGAVFVDEVDEVPAGRTLVLAAHGVTPAVRDRADARGLAVIDATCPLVAKVHTEVRRHAGRGATVFLIGHADHEEVEGTVGEAPDDVIVVADVAEAATVTPRDPDRVAYAMQTTLAVDEAEEIAAVLRGRFPAMAAPRTDDICYATTNRQQAVREITRGRDLLLVLGSANSSNSLRLVEVAERDGVPARLIDDASALDLAILAGTTRIGITAGASAPPHLVDDLVTSLRGLGPAAVIEANGEPEDLRFHLPKEVC
ncbi:MAG TPA: 4-hydroxy-3-methylbut-2-enyl diphosphate reductase [Micromonosporaceae bacterium]